ncbi:hypothetical protein CR513_63127, partial [Mucuna pruriens]
IDETCHAYLKCRSCQPILKRYPLLNDDHPRHFQTSWFDLYSSWLEYSNGRDAIFCLSCFLFGKKTSNHLGSNIFIEKGFNSWKKFQLALVVTSREVVCIHEFFTQLTFIVNIVRASSKRYDQLQVAQEINITNMIANNELQTSKGENQVGILQRTRDTQWISHF